MILPRFRAAPQDVARASVIDHPQVNRFRGSGLFLQVDGRGIVPVGSVGEGRIDVDGF